MGALVCTHGMPSPKSCVDCMEEGPVAAPATWRKVGSPFPARYSSTCPRCGDPTFVGDVVQRWDRGDERTLYLHEECTP